jgi:hypothetical protein
VKKCNHPEEMLTLFVMSYGIDVILVKCHAMCARRYVPAFLRNVLSPSSALTTEIISF